jgi:hypothetical protein
LDGLRLTKHKFYSVTCPFFLDRNPHRRYARITRLRYFSESIKFEVGWINPRFE